MNKNQKRIQLLSDTKVEELYSRPEFNIHEQQLYFTLTASERKALTQFSNTKTRIYFILQLGYFKARQQFFNFSLDEVISDALFMRLFRNSMTLGTYDRQYSGE